MDEKTLAEIQEALSAVRTHFILQEEETPYQTEVWEGGKINLLIAIPSRLTNLCKPCASVHFSKWFRQKYPDSAIAHISLTDVNLLNL